MHSVTQNYNHSSDIDVELSKQNIGNRASFYISKIAEEEKSFKFSEDESQESLFVERLDCNQSDSGEKEYNYIEDQ